MKQYGDIFVETRQRVAAFEYYLEYTKRDKNRFANMCLDDIVDEVYRFLYYTVEPKFLKFCADKENMDFKKYKKMLGLT